MATTPRPRRFLAAVTALLVLLIALAAGAGLWLVRNLYDQSIRTAAARSVLDTGRLIAAQLADHPVLRQPDAGGREWASFRHLARSLQAVEDNLQYVSVTRDGVTLFHEQVAALDGTALPAPTRIPGTEPRSVLIGRELLIAGSNSLPVVTFTVPVPQSGGGAGFVRVGMRKAAVARALGGRADAATSVFRMALATLVLGFTLCAAMVVWILRRDIRREERRRAEEHLAFAGVFASGIVHDFRNPMSSLKLDVQLMAREAEREPGSRSGRLAELAGRASRTLDRMDKLFQEFLYLSRPSSEPPQRVRLGAVVQDSLELMGSRFERAGLAVRTEGDGADLEVRAQPSALKRALINLLTNAEQFSPRGGQIVIRASRDREAGVIEVLDQGPGVPESDREKIFDMFVTTRSGGTGLGLALAKTAVRDNGGAIEVRNRPGGGACFRMALPLAGAERGAAPAP